MDAQASTRCYLAYRATSNIRDIQLCTVALPHTCICVEFAFSATKFSCKNPANQEHTCVCRAVPRLSFLSPTHIVVPFIIQRCKCLLAQSTGNALSLNPPTHSLGLWGRLYFLVQFAGTFSTFGTADSAVLNHVGQPLWHAGSAVLIKEMQFARGVGQQLILPCLFRRFQCVTRYAYFLSFCL